METFKFFLSILLITATHVLMYFLGKSNGYSKGHHQGFMCAKRAYHARKKASLYLHDTIPTKEEP